MAELFTADNLAALLTLTLMELVLGIDNVVFLAILVGKLPVAQQKPARTIGLTVAIVMRLGLLFGITWIMGLQADLFTIAGHPFSGKDLILLVGGAFLIYKSTHEIHHKLEAAYDEGEAPRARSMASAIVQIVILDLVFSLDSVITAVGMSRSIAIMAVAMVTAVAVMLWFSGGITDFVNRHPSVKMLALAFLLLIGVMLAADGMRQHISKGYIYSAMTFSMFVEMLNMRAGRKPAPVRLHEPGGSL